MPRTTFNRRGRITVPKVARQAPGFDFRVLWAVFLGGFLLLALPELRAQSPAEYTRAGMGLLQQGQAAEALTYLDAALKLDPGNIEALYGSSYALVLLGRQGEGKARLDKLLATVPGHVEGQNLLMSLGAAQVSGSSALPRGSLTLYDEGWGAAGAAKAFPPSAKIDPSAQAAFQGASCLKLLFDPNTSSGMEFSLSGLKGLPPAEGFQAFANGGALVFWIRGNLGGEDCELDFLSPPAPAFDNRPYRNTLGLSPYAFVGRTWNRVVIPLSDFKEQGFLWAGDRGNQYSPWDWRAVKALRFVSAKSNRAENTVYLDRIAFVPSYDPAEAVALKNQAREQRYAQIADGQGNLVIFSEEQLGGSFYATPDQKSTIIVDESEFKEGKRSLKFTPFVDAGSSFGGHLNYLDLEPLRPRGKLSFWVKGKNGGESFRVGFATRTPEGLRAVGSLELGAYAEVTGKWSMVRIPLADFPPTGTLAGPPNSPLPMNYAITDEWALMFPKSSEPEVVVWMDELKITKD